MSSQSGQTAFDIAAALIETQPGFDQMQLHKLLYLSQAACIAWYDAPLFSDQIEAWRWGPVVRGVAGHYMQYDADPIESPASGDTSSLSDEAWSVVRRIVERYGEVPGPELASLLKGPGTPWQEARGDIPQDAPSQAEITPASMREYHRAHGVTAIEPTAAVLNLAGRFVNGDQDAVTDLMELAASAHPQDR